MQRKNKFFSDSLSSILDIYTNIHIHTLTHTIFYPRHIADCCMQEWVKTGRIGLPNFFPQNSKQKMRGCSQDVSTHALQVNNGEEQFLQIRLVFSRLTTPSWGTQSALSYSGIATASHTFATFLCPSCPLLGPSSFSSFTNSHSNFVSFFASLAHLSFSYTSTNGVISTPCMPPHILGAKHIAFHLSRTSHEKIHNSPLNTFPRRSTKKRAEDRRWGRKTAKARNRMEVLVNGNLATS